jgi:hypothetical protein
VTPAECMIVDHEVSCECPPGFQGSKGTSCTKGEIFIINKNLSSSKIPQK